MNFKKLGLKLAIIIVIFSFSTGAFYPALAADPCFHSVFGYVYINEFLAPEGTEIKLVFYEDPEEIYDFTDSFSYYQVDFLNHDWEEGFFFVNFEGEWFVPYDNVSVEIFPDDIGYRVDLHVNTLGSPPYKPGNPNPANNSVNVTLNPSLGVTVTDPDNDSMDVFFYDASDDSLIGTDNNVNSGDVASVQWKDLSYNTMYYWYAIANDSLYETKSDEWCFTTKSNSPPDKPVNPTPEDGAEGVLLDPELSVFVTDPDDDLLDVIFFDSSDDSIIGTDLAVESGSAAKVTWEGLAYNTTYTWYVISDDGIYETRSDNFSFTTKEEDNTPPEVEITSPQKGLYIFDRKILPRFIRPALIIGRITIEANATDDDSGIERVEFYINGKLKANVTSEPYVFLWKRDRIRLLHIFSIKVVAYDYSGETATDKMIVRKFL